MSDLIDRQAAIDSIRECVDCADANCEWDLKQGYLNAIECIEEEPSAEPERKKGKWVIRDNPRTGWYRITCSECGEDVTATAPCIGFFPNAKVNWDYCPNCGARMEEK